MCDLDLAETAATTTPLTKLLDDINWTEYRRSSFITTSSDVRVSAWKSLTAGSKYYIQSDIKNGGGGAHGSVGVEIEQSTLNTAHPRNVKEV